MMDSGWLVPVPRQYQHHVSPTINSNNIDHAEAVTLTTLDFDHVCRGKTHTNVLIWRAFNVVAELSSHGNGIKNTDITGGYRK